MKIRRKLWLLAGVAAVTAMTSPARSDRFPKLNVAPLCHVITDRSNLQLGFDTVTFDECMKAEQKDRQTMINEWPTFSSSDRKPCIAEVTTTGVSRTYLKIEGGSRSAIRGG